MQQGPSSLPENQVFLANWADTLSRAVRAAGGEPALLMVWPSLDRAFAFDDVRDAYRNAAVGVGGAFIPAGEALRALHEQGPDFTPFGADGFHPSDHGTILAAYVVAGTLFGDDVSSFDASDIFDDRFRGERVSWSGTLCSLDSYTFDFDFGSEPGAKAKVEISMPGKGEEAEHRIVATVQISPENAEQLAGQVGKPVTFEGELLKVDGLMNNVYVKEASLR